MKFFKAKILLLGAGAVGKTSLIKQYTEGEFKKDYIPTVGVEFFPKEIILNDFQIKSKIWDIAGQEKFTLYKDSVNYYTYFKGAHAALVVFDYSRPETFAILETEWISSLHEISGKVPFVLIGNKFDLEKQVKQDKINAFINTHGVPFIETSAMNNINVEEAFFKIFKAILKQYALI